MPNSRWDLIFEGKAEKQFLQLPKNIQKRILDYFDERILHLKDPMIHANALQGELHGLYRFRIGEYRVITVRDQGKMVIVAVNIGHRREIYR